MKKKYNPFKMWGSWVGAILGMFPFIYIFSGKSFNWICLNHNMGAVLPSGQTLTGLCGSYLFKYSPISGDIGGDFTISILLLPIVGFLIGWGINSLWRKYK